MSRLEIRYDSHASPDAAVLHLRGEATYKEAPELRRHLFDAFDNAAADRLVIELAAVDKMDTAAMAVLVEGLLATRNQRPQLFFCTPSESVRKIFELAGLDDALARCYGCLGDALEASACDCT